jgi:non-ribosomal peptide synthase protein (TIGR01720 family)
VSALDEALRARVERLTPEGRALLEERFGLSAEARRPAANALIAWIVPADGAVGPTQLAAFLREQVPEHMVPAAFVFLDALPRLPNGKADLAALPDPAPAGDDGTFIAPRDTREEALAAIWSNVLGVDRIGVHDNFFELGGDSILSIQVVARARRAGLHLTPETVFRHQTLGALAAAAGEAPADSLEAAPASAPLAPVQAWFFEQPLASPHHWHQCVWLRPPSDFDAQRFEHAIRRLVEHHDALRLSFARHGSGWMQHLTAPEPVPVREIALPRGNGDDVAHSLRRAADGICAATDLSRGPLVRAAIVRRADGAVDRLLLAVHHLAVDAVSWSILLEDLRAFYTGDSPAPIRTTSFLSWCAALREMATTPALDADAEYWRALPHDAPPLPREFDGEFDEASAQTVQAALDEDATSRLVHEVYQAYNTNVEDVLLAALVRTIADWSGAGRVRVGLERHGREPLVPAADLSRTIGWMTAYFPVVLEAPGEADAGGVLRATKETLRAIPHRGAGYGVLRYLRDDAGSRALAALPAPELIFNHAGRIDGDGDGAWTMLASPFASRAPDNCRAHRIEVNTFIAGGVLHVHWTAGAAQYGRATLERLATRFLVEVRGLCAHALAARTSGYTPADFPDAGFDQAALDRFLEGLGA